MGVQSGVAEAVILASLAESTCSTRYARSASTTSRRWSTQSPQRCGTKSGATYTSNGYRQSLQVAIDIVVANGITTVAAGA